jgi:microcystin-dependent protein
MEPFIGQLQLFGFNFAPVGWALCNGQLLSISANTALFSLLGTMYGGNGQTTFGLPDLRGRVPLHYGQGPGLSTYTQGEVGGAESITLNKNEIAPHTHGAQGSAAGTSKSPSGLVPGYNDAAPSYGAPDGTAMHPGMIGPNAGGQPHENRQPYLVLNWCIAVEGIYPSRP